MDYILGKIFCFCYSIVNDYFISLILFTFVIKVMLLPVSIWVHLNGIKLVKMTPDINILKIKYYGDRDVITDKTFELYKKNRYSPFIGVIPLCLQLWILFAVINVINEPESVGLVQNVFFVGELPFYSYVNDLGGFYFVLPVLAALSSFFMVFTQNMSNVIQAEQSKFNKYGVLVLSVCLSLYLGVFAKVGVVCYWILSNLLSVGQMYILNWVIDPKKSVDYDALNRTRQELSVMNSKDKALTLEQRRFQNKCYKEFFSISNKHIVFYSEQGGFYRYFRSLIDWLLRNTNVIVHYVTSDFNDEIFDKSDFGDRLKAYFIGDRKLITLFMKMDADIVVMTTPDLDNYHLKRSYVDKHTRYVYMPHAIGSINTTLRRNALDNYDIIFCTGKRMQMEIRAKENLYGTAKKVTVLTGYGYIDDLRSQYNGSILSAERRDRPVVMIAPSYQMDNIMDSCIDNILSVLNSFDCDTILRPHPQYVKRKGLEWENLKKKYSNMSVIFDDDFSNSISFRDVDVMITDWSGIGFEFALCTYKPCIFVDTPMKAINPDYDKIDVVPIDLIARDEIGIHVRSDDLAVFECAVNTCLNNADDWKDRISKFIDKEVSNIDNFAKVAGTYLVDELMKEDVTNEER